MKIVKPIDRSNPFFIFSLSSTEKYSDSFGRRMLVIGPDRKVSENETVKTKLYIPRVETLRKYDTTNLSTFWDPYPIVLDKTRGSAYETTWPGRYM